MKTYTKDISQRHIFFVEEDIYERHISKTYSKLHVKTYTGGFQKERCKTPKMLTFDWLARFCT